MKRISPRTIPVCAAAVAAIGLILPAVAQDESTATDTASQAQPADAAPQDAEQTPGQSANQPAGQPAAQPADLPEIDRVSYAIGYMVGREYHRNEIELKPDAFVEGLRAGLTGGEGRVSQEELQATLMNFQRQMQMRQVQKAQEQAAQGQAFLEENKAKQGVQVTESGLQYQVIEQGEGASPGPQDTVRVHYRGTLPDGTQFDSSYDRGEPAEFRVNEVIAGWTEALQMMKPGAKYRLVIPPQIAYGEAGRPPVIPPSAVLVFDVELLDVLPE